MTPTAQLDAPVEGPELPSLDPGLQLLEIETDDRSDRIGPLQSLVVDHLLGRDGTAAWIDTHGYVMPSSLQRIAPSDRLLDRIHVARGFTPYQHFAITETLHASPPAALDLVVVPAVDGQYSDADMATARAETLFLRTLARLAAIARELSIPILVTRTQADDFAAPVDRLADRTITCEYTDLGPRFESQDFETLVYPLENGCYQTTLAYWQQIIAARVQAQPTTQDHTPTPEVAADGPY